MLNTKQLKQVREEREARVDAVNNPAEALTLTLNLFAEVARV